MSRQLGDVPEVLHSAWVRKSLLYSHIWTSVDLLLLDAFTDMDDAILQGIIDATESVATNPSWNVWLRPLRI